MKVVIAGIALTATLAGAVVGAGASIYSANLAADTQTQVAQSNFLHNQRQIAYQTFLTDFSVARELATNVKSMHAPVGSPEFGREVSPEEYRAAMDKIRADQGVITLIGSSQVIIDVDLLVRGLDDIYDRWQHLGSGILPQGYTVYAYMDEIVDHFAPQAKALLDDARADLGTELK
jgi:hypothetical protein